jgi:hypothetical protein
VVFNCARSHENEQNKFIEDLRKGCANLVKHTKDHPESACPVLFVRLCASASIDNCRQWASDYFAQYPRERVGLILLYQAAIVTSGNSTAITHYTLPILGPQFDGWTRPAGGPVRSLPPMSFLIGTILSEASRKVLQTDKGQISLDDTYTYQRGDIYRFYHWDGAELHAHMANPAPRIRVHAEIGNETGSLALQGIWPETGELLLLP